MASISYTDLSPAAKSSYDGMLEYPISLSPYNGKVYLTTDKNAAFLFLKRIHANDKRPYIAEELTRELISSLDRVIELSARGYRNDYLIYIPANKNEDFSGNIIAVHVAHSVASVLGRLFNRIGYPITNESSAPYYYSLNYLVGACINNFLYQTNVTLVTLNDQTNKNLVEIGYDTVGYYGMAYNRLLNNTQVNADLNGWSATTWFSI